MSSTFGWMAVRIGAPQEDTYFVHISETLALAYAKERARVENTPWGVYKITQTHHVSVPAVVVKDV